MAGEICLGSNSQLKNQSFTEQAKDSAILFSFKSEA